MKLEIMSVCCFSTAHVTKQDNDKLAAHAGPLLSEYTVPIAGLHIAEDEGGFFVWTGYSVCVDDRESFLEKLRNDSWSDALVALISLAQDHRCSYLRLDKDGPVYKKLPVYNW